MELASRSSSLSPSPSRLVVVVPTTGNRPDLLARCLASVGAQTLAPARVLVAVDGAGGVVQRVATQVSAWLPAAEVLPNTLTAGASGAWNSALHRLEASGEPMDTLVSFLDDDDWWASHYLAGVAEVAEGADAIAAAFWRHDADHPDGVVVQPPAGLYPDAFLVGNPGVQGSNLTLRLRTWLAVGGFDEALRSCTDRDICIRLADIGAQLRVQRTPACHHDAHHGHARLSDPASAAKLDGLTSFYRKYRWRMAESVRIAFEDRAKRLFGWGPPTAVKATIAKKRKPQQTERTLKLAVGVIVDGDQPDRATRLVGDLARLEAVPAVGRLDVILLENGDPDGFRRVVDRAEGLGLALWPVAGAVQCSVAGSLGLGQDLARKKSIAESRTLLQRFVAATARLGEDTVGWILDDDMRLPSDLELLVSDVQRARDAGYDAVIGTARGDPPIPVAGAVRTQMVDLVHFLAGAAVRHPAETLLPGEQVNAPWTADRRDYYHDHPREETDRLESPFMPVCDAPNVREALRHVGSKCRRILAGEQLFRPLLVPDTDPVAAAHDSLMRGGNTLVFRLDLLREAPNLAPRFGARFARRSDTLWAIHARYRSGRRIAAMPIALVHDRSDDVRVGIDMGTWADDILGHAFARAYDEILKARPPDAGPLTAQERAQLMTRTRGHVDGRFGQCRLGAHRIRGLTSAVRRTADVAAPTWWTADPDTAAAVANLRRLADEVDEAFSPAAIARLGASLHDRLQAHGIDAFLDEVERALPGGPADSVELSSWTRDSRIARARRLVAKHLRLQADGVLGLGAEGVVLGVGERAIKVFDRWSRSSRADSLPALRRLLEKAVPGALPAVYAVHECREAVMVDMERLDGQPYRGGHGPQLLGMLRGLVHAGWVHSNVHPKNILLTRAGARLVDIGKSLEVATDTGIAAMVRRTWLSWRFAFRPDLNELLRRSIDDDDFAELTGWRVLRDALPDVTAKDRLDLRLEHHVRERGDARLLDYGCGKPRTVHRLMPADRLVAFDIDANLRLRWARELPEARFVDLPALDEVLAEGAEFDAVLCSLVLCVVPDDDVPGVLARARAAVAGCGRVLVSICEPTALHTAESDYQCRHVAPGARYRDRFAYRKTVRASGRERIDYHRPLDWYRRAFARAGFRVAAEETIDGLDVQRFETMPEFRVFHLEPLPAVGVRTSLVIKACAMEADSLDAIIRHQVTQIGRPRAFDEVVVALDPHAGPFPRSWHPGQIHRVDTTLSRLQAEGVIDRVIRGPEEGAGAPLSERWFGLDHAGTHVANGQAALAFLHAVESCTGDLILHLDADILIGRPDADADFAQEAVDTFAAHPTAVTLSLPVHGDTTRPPSDGEGGVPFRVEAMVGWIHRSRLLALRPLPNTLHNGRLALPWHRSLDVHVRQGAALSLRKGSQALWFTGIDNARKPRLAELHLLVDRVEAGFVPDGQRGQPLLTGPGTDWLGPVRREDLVVVVCGRNVPPGRVRRCFDSLAAQQGAAWAAIVVDDASDDGCAETVTAACTRFGDRVTYVRQRERQGLLANTALAISRLCANPDAVIALLDLDDALGTANALAEVALRHRDGADVTVGSMVRTDKHAAYPVDFALAREHRGGNVWQHLRSFRKRLFDRIAVEDLRPGGEWVDLANDWAFMLPIVEMAEHPVHIARPLYLHEPSTRRPQDERDRREAVVADIVRRPSYRSAERAFRPLETMTTLCYHRVVEDVNEPLARLYARRGLAVSLATFAQQMRSVIRRFSPVGLRDVVRAVRGESRLPERALLVTFDDGYRDFIDLAVPVLARSGVPAVQFARVPEADGLPSWAPLDLLRVLLVEAGVSAEDAVTEVSGDARAALLRLPHDEQLRAIRERAGCLGIDIDRLDRGQLYAGWSRLRDLRRIGIDLAGHGVAHERWTELKPHHLTEAARATALWLERADLPRVMAWPDGAVSDDTVSAVRQAGIDLAFALHDVPTGVADQWAIRRVLVPDDPDFLDQLATDAQKEAA